MNIENIGTKIIFGTKCYVYKLNTENTEVFMCVDRTNYENENRYVVLVDIKKFYKYWKDQNGREFAKKVSVSEENHIKKKYDAAISGFQHGIEDPVPIPVVSAYMQRTEMKKIFHYKNIIEKLRINYTNGITRTQWLINNRFESCPVETSHDSAYLIYEYFGIKGTEIYTVEEIIGN